MTSGSKATISCEERAEQRPLVAREPHRRRGRSGFSANDDAFAVGRGHRRREERAIEALGLDVDREHREVHEHV